ncbi:MAG: cytochrome c1, partial [Pseudomonadota bacterium]
SLMAKARAGFHGPYGTGLAQLFNGMGGAEYIASLLTSYTGSEREEAGAFLYGNDAYGGYLAMAQPLYGDDVVYEDGTEATIEQQAKDVAAFLMWTAEPKMMARKQAGFVGVVFLGVLTVLLYLTNKRLWAPIKARAKETPAE